MKNFVPILFSLILISFLAAGQSADEKEVAAAVEKLRNAMINPDKATLDGLAADELSYGHSSGKIENKAEFVEALVSGKSDFKSIDISEQTVRISGNAAIVRHHFKGDLVSNGTASTVNLSVLTVWQKQKGGWKLIARQAVKI